MLFDGLASHWISPSHSASVEPVVHTYEIGHEEHAAALFLTAHEACVRAVLRLQSW